MTDIYVDVTVYRAGTIDNPEQPLTIDNVDKIIVDHTTGIASHYEVIALDWYDEYEGVIDTGDIIEITLGEDADNALQLRGRVFNVSFKDETLKMTGQDWTYHILGNRVTKRYGGQDYGFIMRDLITQYCTSLKIDFLFDTGIIMDERYSGQYQDLLFVMNELTGRIDHEWRVRADRQVVQYPDGLHIEFIDGFNEEDEAEDPDGWTEVAGTWAVGSSQYAGSHTDVGITKVVTTTKDSQDIRCVINIDAGGTNDIAFIIFDYVSSTDFKYVALDADNNLWIIGDYDGSFNTRDSNGSTIDTGTDYRTRTTIVGDTVTIYEWDTSTEVWTEQATYDFSGLPETIGTGEIGLGLNNSTATFDDFIIYSYALITLDSSEFLTHDIARRDFRELVNKQTVVGGLARLFDEFKTTLHQWSTTYQADKGTLEIDVDNEWLDIQETDGGDTYEMRIYTNDTYKNLGIEATATIITGSDEDNLCLYYRQVDDDNLYRVKFDADANTVTLAKIVTGTPTTIKTVSQTIDAGTEYVFGVKCIDDNHKAYLGDIVLYDIQDATYTKFGRAGIGVDASDIHCTLFDLRSDKDIIASAQDPTLFATWGNKSGEPIFDQDIVTRDQALSRAQYILDLGRYVKTRGTIKDDGRIDINIGDIVVVNIPEADISNVNYRVFGIMHEFNDAGWSTYYNVAEDTPRMEQVFKRIIFSQASLIYGSTLTRQLELVDTQTLATLGYYESIYKTPYYTFKIDTCEVDFFSVY